ncbi:nucleotidyltransferase domain-containing protein [Candidatus Poriferisodalis sp.]|uniref:nucleotidyltransferase domain-containing protein n=1 Tax=Candidatus Poriferisodalis sp. TaxID=3101277 RepID=UPI003B02E334
MAPSAPSIDDARRAAAELASAGVGRVLLFGSLARGDTRASDIDLVAIYDDLGDYSDRWDRRCELALRAEAAAGCSVDLLVTDAPEWAVRTQRVPCSLEAHIDTYAMLLTDSGAHVDIDWDKEIGLPDNAIAEVQTRHLDMTVAVSRLADAARVGDNELDAIGDDDTEAFVSAEEWRFAGACSQAHLVVECGAKTMIALAAGTAPPRSHNIDTLVDLLPADERSVWAALTADIDTAEFHQWRQGGTYAADLPIDGFDEDYLATVASVAINVAAHVASRCAAAGIDAAQIRLSTRSEHRLRTALGGPMRVEADHPIRHPDSSKDAE